MDIKPLEVLQTTSINAPITTRPPPSSDKRSKVRGNDWYKNCCPLNHSRILCSSNPQTCPLLFLFHKKSLLFRSSFFCFLYYLLFQSFIFFYKFANIHSAHINPKNIVFWVSRKSSKYLSWLEWALPMKVTFKRRQKAVIEIMQKYPKSKDREGKANKQTFRPVLEALEILNSTAQKDHRHQLLSLIYES